MHHPSMLNLLALLLQSTPEVPSQPEECQQAATHLRLAPEQPSSEHVVCVTPGLTTNLLFNSALAPGAVRVPEGAGEAWLDVGRHTLTVYPKEDMKPGVKRKVEVHFQDSALPASVTFVLVGTSWGAARQVEVHREPRTLEACQRDEEALHEELLQCREETRRLRADASRPVGLLGALADGTLSEAGIALKDIRARLTLLPDTFVLEKAFSYRVLAPSPHERELRRVSVAVDLLIRQRDKSPGTALRALLVGPKGTEPKPVQVWQPESPPGAGQARLVLAAELTQAEARASWRLQVWDTQGELLMALGNITFP